MELERSSKRPMITLETKMRDIPAPFAHDILPHLTFYGFEPCWIWMHTVDQKGYPVWRRKSAYTGKRESLSIRQQVARLFWHFASDGVVRMTCETVNCLNPAHMAIHSPTWAKSGNTR